MSNQNKHYKYNGILQNKKKKTFKIYKKIYYDP
jgi:hypothetical protein